jgi:hypothetical protein
MKRAEVRLRVVEAKQRDAGRGKARIDDETMRLLGIMVGDVIEIKGKKITAAVAWPSYRGDQGKKLIRMDGLVRKNAEVTLNEDVTIKKAEVKQAKSVILAPVNIRLNVDSEFIDFVKSRLIETPIVENNSVFVVILGSAIPFTIVKTTPHGIVKVSNTTNIQLINQLSSEAKKKLSDELTFQRFRFLKELEKECTADYSRFRIPNLIEHEHEGKVLTEAKKKAKTINESVKVFVDLWEKRGKIVTIDWAIVKSDSTVEYIYNPQQVKSASPKEDQRMDTIDLIIKSIKEHEKLLDNLFEKLQRQIETINEILKSKKA